MARPRRNPPDPGRQAARRRRIRTTFTNPFCPFRDRCLDRHQDDEILDCSGCLHEHETISKSELSLDIAGCMRLLYRLYVRDSVAWLPLEVVMGAVLGDRYRDTTFHAYHRKDRAES